MDIVRGLFSALPELPAPVVTLGAFDGVHRGHQRILAATVEWAREVGGRSVVITFDPLPKSVVGRGEALCITSLPHRLLLLERCGPDAAAVLAFDATLAAMAPEAFVHDVVVGWLGARRVVLGRNSTFGQGGRGNLELLSSLERDGLLEARSPEPVMHEGELVSSTAIRAAIARGDLGAVSVMLGRPFSLFGTVVRGRARGRHLGFPTANLDLAHEAFPPDGVYACVTCVDGGPHSAITYIGSRPTFESADAVPVVEVHLIDLEADLYGRQLEVHFVRKLRGDMRFPSAEALVTQMQADREAARQAVATVACPCVDRRAQ